MSRKPRKDATPAAKDNTPLAGCWQCRSRRLVIDLAGIVRCSVCFKSQHPIVSRGSLDELTPFLIARGQSWRGADAALACPRGQGYNGPATKPKRGGTRRKGR